MVCALYVSIAFIVVLSMHLNCPCVFGEAILKICNKVVVNKKLHISYVGHAMCIYIIAQSSTGAGGRAAWLDENPTWGPGPWGVGSNHTVSKLQH